MMANKSCSLNRIVWLFQRVSLTVALDPVLVECITLIAPTTVAANSIFASAVQAHARKLDALVDILTLGEAISARTQFLVGLRARFGTQLALVAAPATAHRATTQALREVALYGIDALPVTMLQVACFLPRIDARGVYKRDQEWENNGVSRK